MSAWAGWLSAPSSHRYEAEKARRQGVQQDVEDLRKELDGLTIVTTDLEMEIEGLREEHILRRKDHEQVEIRIQNTLGKILSQESLLPCN